MIVNKIEKKDNHILFQTSEGLMRIMPYSETSVRVTYTRDASFSEKESLMIVAKEGAFTGWKFEDLEHEAVLKSKAIALVINKNTSAIIYKDSEGNVIIKEPENGGKSLEKIDVLKTVFDDVTIAEEKSVDGIRTRVSGYKKIIDRQAYHTKLELEFDEDEAIYGFGSHEEGLFNLRGHYQYLYQQNMKAVVPVLMSSKGYGILVDSYSLMSFHDDEYGSYIWTDVDDEMDFYFIYGPKLDQVVKGYRHLTGKAPMLPKWAFGYMQSKERYKSQEELISIVKEYRDRQIPLDTIILDWHSWPGELWGQKSFDPTRFPNPTAMMEEIHVLDARLMISIWPIMAAGGMNHQEMKENDLLLGNQATYNAFDEKARSMYWQQTNDGLFAHGVDAWWCDCTEPFEADWTGSIKPEPEERVRINTNEAKKYLDPAYINAFSLEHSKGIYEGQRQITDSKRVVNLTRSSYGGQHRYGTITWSGDVAASWDTLRKQIVAGLNFCVTGEPYWTVDIGAFFSGGKAKWSYWCTDETIPPPWFLAGDYDDGCEDLGYRELYLRWFQYGAFLPIFRSHGTDTPREVWRFGEPGSIYYDTLVKFIHLRYRLMPYIYSLVGKTTHEDYTMMRLLAFDFPEDVQVRGLDNQYMFGDAFLVCPITEPMVYGPNSKKIEGKLKSRELYLPAGISWYDFWNGKKYEGGTYIEVHADLDTMPLFVKAGSIIPMGPKVQNTSEKTEAPWELRIYPGADGEFIVYEDEGDNYNYEAGDYSSYKIFWKDISKTLTFGKRNGAFKGMVGHRTYKIVLINGDNGCGVEEAIIDRRISYNGQPLKIGF